MFPRPAESQPNLLLQREGCSSTAQTAFKESDGLDGGVTLCG